MVPETRQQKFIGSKYIEQDFNELQNKKETIPFESGKDFALDDNQ